MKIDRETRAKIKKRIDDILIAHPEYGKKRVNKELRKEFGVGVRESSILRAKYDLSINPDYSYKTPSFYERGSVPRRQREAYKVFRDTGVFTVFEAREFSGNYKADCFEEYVYMRDMLDYRRELIADLRSQGYKGAALAERVWQEYYKEEWTSPTTGEPSPWAMMRHFRREAIRRGEYTESEDRHGEITEDSLREQRRRGRQRAKARREGDEREMARYREQRRGQKARARDREREKKRAAEH